MTEAITAGSITEEAGVDAGKWDRMPGERVLAETVLAMEKRGMKVIVASGRKDALEKLRGLVPEGAEVMNGTSTTLIEIGFIDALERGDMGWRSVHKVINSENDEAKRHELRRKSVCSDYFVSGVNAIARTGELVACDRSGSRVGAFPFAAKNLIIVAGANKIAPSLEDALRRVREFAYPLENVRAKRVYGVGSVLGKFVILAAEETGRVTVVLVKERLGY